MRGASIRPNGPGKPTTVPNPGSVSAVGPAGAAPQPRVKNTRDYGKAMPADTAPSPSPQPFGSSGSRLGGI